MEQNMEFEDIFKRKEEKLQPNFKLEIGLFLLCLHLS